jgi:hypothetical protein
MKNKISSFFLVLKVAIVFCVLALPFMVAYAVATIGESNENRKA